MAEGVQPASRPTKLPAAPGTVTAPVRSGTTGGLWRTAIRSGLGPVLAGDQFTGQRAGGDDDGRLEHVQLVARALVVSSRAATTAPPPANTGTATAAVWSALLAGRRHPRHPGDREGASKSGADTIVNGVYWSKPVSMTASTVSGGANASSALPIAVAWAGRVRVSNDVRGC